MWFKGKLYLFKLRGDKIDVGHIALKRESSAAVQKKVALVNDNKNVKIRYRQIAKRIIAKRSRPRKYPLIQIGVVQADLCVRYRCAMKSQDPAADVCELSVLSEKLLL